MNTKLQSAAHQRSESKLASEAAAGVRAARRHIARICVLLDTSSACRCVPRWPRIHAHQI